MPPEEGSEQTGQEAAAWLRLLVHRPTMARFVLFGAWLRGSTERCVAFLKVHRGRARWPADVQDLPKIVDAIQSQIEMASPSAIDTDRSSSAADSFALGLREPRRPARGHLLIRRLACAVAVALGAIGLPLGYENVNGWLSVSTQVGGFQAFELTDGSVVHLNTDSELRVRLSGGLRQLVLVRGEARFNVAHDANRPFVVQAGDTVVRAVGTEFNVRVRGQSNVEVAVIEGVVSVSHHAQRPVSLQALGFPLTVQGVGARLMAGRAAHDVAGSISVDPRSDAERRFEDGWLRGRFLFEGDALGDVVREVNRYNVQQIRIVDPAIEHIMMGGSYSRGDDLRTFLKGLGNIAPIGTREVRRKDTLTTDFEIYLADPDVSSRAPSPKARRRATSR